MSTKMWLLAATLLTLGAALALVACQPVRMLNGITSRDTFSLKENLSYGPEERQKLDIYLPKDQPVKKVVLVFIYGGSWESGSKDEFLFVGEAFARLGYVTVIPDYRLYPEAEFPEFVDDLALGIARLDLHLSSKCPSGRELVLMGHSAGGHMAAMLATEPKYLERNGAGDVQIRALIGLAAPYDLPLDHELVVDKFQRVKNELEANPIRLASSASPPSLLLHGADDTTAYPYHTKRMAERLAELGVPVETHIYEGVRHITLLAGLASRLQFLNPARDDIAAYLIKRQLDPSCD